MGDGELRLDPAKIKALLEWPRPNNVTEVWSFIGVTHYLRKFIAYFSKSTAPLHAGTSGNKPFSQGKKQETFFEEYNGRGKEEGHLVVACYIRRCQFTPQ